MSEYEITALRKEERFKDIGNRIADFVAYPLQMEPELSAAVMRQIIAAAVGRFGALLPQPMIAMLVQRQMQTEVATREQAVRLRRKQVTTKKRRAAISVATRQSVVI